MTHRPKRTKTAAVNACRRSLPVAAALLALAMGAIPAKAHMEITLDPFGEAEAQGIAIIELDHLWVAILGSDHVDLSQASKQTLRLGSRDSAGASARAIKRQDINGDGYGDLLARFDVAETGLIDAEDFAAVLTLGFRDGTWLTAYDTVVRSDDPVDSCTLVGSGLGAVGARCAFTSSIADSSPLNIPDLVAAINADLATFTTLTIEDQSAVVVELWGGDGHEGGTAAVPSCKHGSGGARGYARTILTVAELEAVAEAGADLYVYVGEDGSGSEAGGSSSLVLGQNVLTVLDVLDPSGEDAVAIAGGGGGGGRAHSIQSVCKRGYSGGQGGIAEATTSADASAAGANAATGNKGRGGNQDGDGSGGDGQESSNDGTAGVGGFGSGADALWSGSDVTGAQWPSGQGGKVQNSAGGGGGGYGGGGGGRSGDHRGGGGGGGSWARQATVEESVVDDLVLGSSYDPGYPVVVLTFQPVDGL